ncbi:hypothetical protein PR048_019981 [Dryococelus australis]|uniref:Uncharacterized protein n=1 Tax=Dryococelus australis TaxID=614101 RepID=A0ABQ9H514_9NEOP|nr:hypothetical protein PR048_019981 [Dryococelus australis]
MLAHELRCARVGLLTSLRNINTSPTFQKDGAGLEATRTGYLPVPEILQIGRAQLVLPMVQKYRPTLPRYEAATLSSHCLHISFAHLCIRGRGGTAGKVLTFTRVNRAQLPEGQLPDFRSLESCRTMPLDGVAVENYLLELVTYHSDGSRSLPIKLIVPPSSVRLPAISRPLPTPGARVVGAERIGVRVLISGLAR